MEPGINRSELHHAVYEPKTMMFNDAVQSFVAGATLMLAGRIYFALAARDGPPS